MKFSITFITNLLVKDTTQSRAKGWESKSDNIQSNVVILFQHPRYTLLHLSPSFLSLSATKNGFPHVLPHLATAPIGLSRP